MTPSYWNWCQNDVSHQLMTSHGDFTKSPIGKVHLLLMNWRAFNILISETEGW